MQRLFLIFFIICFCLFQVEQISAQQVPDDFTKLTDSILSHENILYREFNQLLNPFAQDEFLLHRLIEKSQKTDNLIGVSYGYNQLGKLKASRFNYPEAIEYHKNALQIATEKGHTWLQLSTLNLLGSNSTRIDFIQNAMEYHQEVIRIVNMEDSPGEDYQKEAAKAYHGLGKIYHSLGRYQESVDFYDQAIKVFLKINYSEGLAYSYNAKGESLEALGKLNESLSHYEKSTQINHLLGSDRLLVLNSVGRAHVLAHQNLAEEAQELISSLMVVGAADTDQELLSLQYIQYGWVLNNLGQYELAEKYLSEGLQLARQLNITNYIYDANTWLHDLWIARGDYEKALKYYTTAQTTRSKIITNRNIQFANDLISASEREKRDLQIQMLARENEIVTLKLRRNQSTLLTGALLMVLIAMILYIAYRQSRIEIEKKIMALEQSMLRSQMNPHFLFNSLNSIKHYIINNEQKNAVLYLNKFSKLVRSILESSSVRENSLKEELETVKLYMNIENIRFEEQIDFKVTVAPDINPQTVRIPSLILQPFLENAIWHGLSSKEGEKKILLEVDQVNKGYITIRIRDNGIGREASEKLNKDRVLKRKSMGISITRDRLAYFSRIHKNSFELSVEDLYKDDGSVAGTQVILKIPTT